MQLIRSRRVAPWAHWASLLLGLGSFSVVACDESQPRDGPEAGMLLTDSEPSASAPLPATPSSTLPPATPEVPRTGLVPNSATCLLVPAAQLRRVGPRHYLIERAALVGALAEFSRQPERWFREKALEWVGQPKTLRVNGINDAEACGVRNGDRIVNVQGVAAGDPLLPKKLQADLATTSELRMVVQRGGKNESLKYDVVERLWN